MNNGQIIFVFLLVWVLMFLLGRKISLWYFRINTAISEMKETNRLLRKIAGEKEFHEIEIETPSIDERTSEQKTEDFNERLYGGKQLTEKEKQDKELTNYIIFFVIAAIVILWLFIS